MKNKFKKLFLLPLLFLLCFVAPGCSESSGESAPQASNSAGQGNASLTAFASKLQLSEGELEELLTTEQNSKLYKLVPASKGNTDKDFWVNLVTTDQEYMQTYFLDRKVLQKKQAADEFSEMISGMWDQSPAQTLLFMVTLDGEYCGIISCHELNYRLGAVISYVTAKQYKNQKVATNALKMVLGLLRRLNEKGIYSVKTVSVWIFDDNEPSIQVAKSGGFSYAENDAQNKRGRYSLDL